MSDSIIHQQTTVRRIFSKCEKDINDLVNHRISSLVGLALEKKATRDEIAKALKLNPALITRYFPKDKGGTHEN